MKKKLRINLVALIVIIVIICLVIVFFVNKKNKNNDQTEIQYTNQLNYVTYTDENGNYVIQYDNGDKTIETRKTDK